MSTVTAVPLQPVRRGYLVWLWLGIAAALIGAVALARVAPAGITLRTLKAGTGPMPTDSDVVLVTYIGKLPNGTVFDQSPQPVPFPVSGVVPGFAQGLKRMQKGGHYLLRIPPRLGYGDKAAGPIPANSTLTFDVTLLDFKSQAEIQRMQMMQQAIMQQQMGGGGAVPGAGAPGAGAPPR